VIELITVQIRFNLINILHEQNETNDRSTQLQPDLYSTYPSAITLKFFSTKLNIIVLRVNYSYYIEIMSDENGVL